MLTSGPFLIRSVDANYLIKIQIKLKGRTPFLKQPGIKQTDRALVYIAPNKPIRGWGWGLPLRLARV